MANVLGVVWMVIGMVTFHTSLTVWAALMLPGPVERARQRQQQKPIPTLFCGVLFVFLTVIVTTTLLQRHNPGVVQLLGWVMVAPVLLGYIVGSAALARLVAPRIRTEMASSSSMVSLVSAALCTSLAGWFPIVGWFLFAPITALMNIGSGVLGLLNRKAAPAPVAAVSPVAPAAPVTTAATPVFDFALPAATPVAPAGYGEQHPQQG